MPSREQQLLDQIAQVARQAGLNEDAVRVLLAIIKTEGGLGGAVGDQGNSYGPLQFHRKGQLPNYAKARGMSVDQAAEKARTDPVDAVKWAVSAYLGDSIKAGQKQGLKGAELATYTQRNGQRSVNPERAGQNYSASQTGGTTMPNPTTPTTPGTPSGGTNDQTPWTGPEYEGYKKAYTQEIEAALTAMKTERQTLLDQYTTWAGTAADTSPENREQASVAYSQMNLLQQRIRDYDTLIRQTEAALASAGNKAIEKTLAAKQQKLKDDIEKGKATEAQATAEFNKIMAQAAMGIEGLISGYASLTAALPQMGTQSMADAAKQMLYNWRELGVNIPDFDLPVMQFDPLDEIRRRLPPATDWKQALMGQQGGGMGASSSAAPPSYPTPPGYIAGPEMPESMGAGGWGQDMAGKAPSAATGFTPPYTGATGMPEPWRQGLLGQGEPSPVQEKPDPIIREGDLPPWTQTIKKIKAWGRAHPDATAEERAAVFQNILNRPAYIGSGGRDYRDIPGAAVGVPQKQPTPPSGPTPSPTPMGPTPGPTMGPAGEATLTPSQQQTLSTWRRRNPGAPPEQERQVIEAIRMGMVP